MKLRVNGELRQDANTGQMHYKTAELVSWWSHMGLYPGDVITAAALPASQPGWNHPGGCKRATRWMRPLQNWGL